MQTPRSTMPTHLHCEDAAAAFCETEVLPHLARGTGELPAHLYQRAAELGWLALGYPEAQGNARPWRCCATLCNRPGAPGQRRADGQPVQSQHWTAAHRPSWAAPSCSARGARGAGERKIAALAITEPGGGTDVIGAQDHGRRAGTIRHRRRENLHHLGYARRLDHGGGAHRPGG